MVTTVFLIVIGISLLWFWARCLFIWKDGGKNLLPTDYHLALPIVLSVTMMYLLLFILILTGTRKYP